MTIFPCEPFEVIIIGGGIAGNTLAAVLARAGRAVLVLERSSVYRDRVRGELFQPWGVAEARRLGLHEVLRRAGGVHHTRLVPYDETVEPAATAAGAVVLRGVMVTAVECGRAPIVRYVRDGVEYAARCRLVIGADGRTSMVRQRAGIALQANAPRRLGTGLLIEDLRGWPEHQLAIGTAGNLVFFVAPQGAGCARVYLMYPVDQRRRFAGPTGWRAFLDSFPLPCMPASACIRRATPAGPCATYPMHDTWTDHPLGDGLALIGDAAGYSDPHIGQGLSIALRDVRMLSGLLLTGDDWSPGALRPYAEERQERMRRLRFYNAVATTLRGEFGPEARERRRRAQARMQAEPALALWRRGALAGLDTVPAAAFDEHVYARLFSPAVRVDA